ncbi:MAG TPA: type 1 glutamine amidotransferase domain-containing protein [Pyrinomonadaceae bacterium]|jgi:protease I
MEPRLKGKRIAILVTDGFEQVELTEPRKALDEAGARTEIVAPVKGEVQGWNHDEKADKFPVDVPLDEANSTHYDALLLPGGVRNPDGLRLEPSAVQFVKEFIATNKPIAAICHAPWILIDAEGVGGKQITSWPSLKIDLINAGAQWVDEEVVADDGLITSRKPDDIPAFNKRMVEEFSLNETVKRMTAG